MAYVNNIRFVKETKINELINPVYKVNNTLSGSEAKAFYDELIAPENSKPKVSKLKKHKRKVNVDNLKNVKQSVTVDGLMKIAELNNMEQLKLLLTSGSISDINVVDRFGWTMLMCAACQGSKEVVEVLLAHGADKSIKDKAGQTAESLARNKGFKDLLYLIRGENSKQKQNFRANTTSIDCETCGKTFYASKAEHERSTLHLFNSKQPKFPTLYGIPEKNKGFQMLLRSGWNKEQGLGQDGCGRKFPIVIKKKDNRHGLGVKKIEDSEKSPAVFRESSRKNRDKRLARNFRMEFY